jgi:hypothetical protein
LWLQAPVVVALCAILAIGWSEQQTLLQLITTPGGKQKEVVQAQPGQQDAANRHKGHKGGYEKEAGGREVYHAKTDDDKHGKRHGGGGYNAGGADSANVLDGKLSYKVEPH